ncbi:hypothetical protein IWW57_006668, partial [Coemansia sp. S610]
ELDEELKKIKSEGQKPSTKDEDLLETTLAELRELKTYKAKEKTQGESKGQSGGESVQEIKQSIFNLEGHLALLLSEKRALDEFIATSKQELLELQMEQVKLK